MRFGDIQYIVAGNLVQRDSRRVFGINAIAALGGTGGAIVCVVGSGEFGLNLAVVQQRFGADRYRERAVLKVAAIFCLANLQHDFIVVLGISHRAGNHRGFGLRFHQIDDVVFRDFIDGDHGLSDFGIDTVIVGGRGFGGIACPVSGVYFGGDDIVLC